MEQYNSGSGNPNLPMFNSGYPSQTGAGGQAYGYSRYQPPMMTGFNNQQWAGAGNPYSYNTPNSYGSNYGGGNFYTPYQSSQYGGGAPNQNPLPLFGRGSFPSFQGQQPGGQPGMGNSGGGNQLGPYGQGYGRGNPYAQMGGQMPMPPSYGGGYDQQQLGGSGMAYGSGQGYGGMLPQWGTKPFNQGGYAGQANQLQGYMGGMEQYYKPGFSQGGTKPYNEGERFGRQPGNPDQGIGAPTAPQYTQAFSQMFGAI
jgi:hypothetical protein